MNDELFLVNIKIKERTPNVYPFSVPSIMNAGELDFKAPVTVLSGGNGCGKTTLLEMIAESLRASRISEAGGQSDKAKIFTKCSRPRISRDILNGQSLRSAEPRRS